MRYPLTAIALAAMVVASASAKADTTDNSIFTFSGFGTVGAVHSSEKNADFNASGQQRYGAGHHEGTSYAVDSRLGAQLSANMGHGLSAVVQVISEQRPDGTWTPAVEWANLKYAFNDDFSVRVGRIALPAMLYSNSRKVGLTLPVVRAPIESYRTNTLSSNDGVDATYRAHFGSVTNTTTVFYGKKDIELPDLSQPQATSKVSLKDSMGVSNSAEFGDAMVRAAYMRTKLTVESLRPLAASPIPQVAAIGKLAIDQKAESYSVAGSYDPGNWFVIAEAAMLKTGLTGTYRSHYVIGGMRFGDVTPYALYSEGKQTKASAMPGAAENNQQTLAAGVRWDFTKGAAFKLQFDRINLDEGSSGTLANFTPAFRPGGHLNVTSAVVDFIF